MTYVGKRYEAAVQEALAVVFRCRSCHWEGQAIVQTKGTGHGSSFFRMNQQGAREEAWNNARITSAANARSLPKRCQALREHFGKRIEAGKAAGLSLRFKAKDLAQKALSWENGEEFALIKMIEVAARLMGV